MKSIEQQYNIDNRILETVKLFFENEGKISDNDLARILTLNEIKTSSSTVGRDLTNKRTMELIGEEQFELILKLREENKRIGNIKGGKNSVANNDILKDENGQFTGSKKRNH